MAGTSLRFFGWLLVATLTLVPTAALSDDGQGDDDDDQGEATVVRGTITAISTVTDSNGIVTSATLTFTRTDDDVSISKQATIDSTTTINVNGVSKALADFVTDVTNATTYAALPQYRGSAQTPSGASVASLVTVEARPNIVTGTVTSVVSNVDSTGALTSVTVNFTRTHDGTTTNLAVTADSNTGTILIDGKAAALSDLANIAAGVLVGVRVEVAAPIVAGAPEASIVSVSTTAQRFTNVSGTITAFKDLAQGAN